MAKVGKIQFNFLGEDKEIPVNCNSSGKFSCNVPVEVAIDLRIDKELKGDTMIELKKAFFDALKLFTESTRKEELLLVVRYKACGGCNRNGENGYPLFATNGHAPYHLSVSFESISALALDYDVVIKESINGKVAYYNGRQGKEFGFPSEEQKNNPEKRFKHGNYYMRDGYKVIPYSPEAHATLKGATETIRKMSEMLFNFIEQEPAVIESQLKNHLLLA